jgi:integrase
MLVERLQRDGMSAKDVETGLTYLYHFTVAFNQEAGSLPIEDIRHLRGDQQGSLFAQAAWERLQRECSWGLKHTADVRCQLARVLMLQCESVAYVINPTMRKGTNVHFDCQRSHLNSFSLHEALPLDIRRRTNHADYRLMVRIGEEFSNCLRSISKCHLQKVLLFFQALILGGNDLVSWFPEGVDDGVDARWSFLRHQKPKAWLLRYARLCERHAMQRMSFDHFKRQVRYMSLFYSKVLNPGSRSAIPLPVCGGRRVPRDAPWGEGSSSSSLATSAGSSAMDEHLREERQELRSILATIRSDACTVVSPEQEERVFAFSCEEVEVIVNTASSTLERLVIVVLLSTGLRLGGLSRLRFDGSLLETPNRATQIPTHLFTVEKNGKSRKVELNATCRVLLARWYRDERGDVRSPFGFPSRTASDRPCSTRRLWCVCRAIFTRAKMTGDHLHPHTFRHTVIQMLYMIGKSFECIAKWIGHANPSITSGVYGRLKSDDVSSALQGVPFIPQVDRGSRKDAWLRVAKLINEPYTFPDAEWDGMRPLSNEVAVGHRLQALNAARASNDTIRSAVEAAKDAKIRELEARLAVYGH